MGVSLLALAKSIYYFLKSMKTSATEPPNTLSYNVFFFFGN